MVGRQSSVRCTRQWAGMCSAEVQAEPPCRCWGAMGCLWALHSRMASCLQGLLLLGSHEVDHVYSLGP